MGLLSHCKKPNLSKIAAVAMLFASNLTLVDLDIGVFVQFSVSFRRYLNF